MPTNRKDDDRAVRARVEEWFDALHQADTERLGEMLTGDAVWMPPGTPAVTGRPEVVDRLAEQLDRHRPHVQVELDEVRVAEDLAYVRLRERGRWSPTGAGQVLRVAQKNLFVLFRTGGTWRVGRWIGNFDHEPEPEAPARLVLAGPGFRIALLGTPRVRVAQALESSNGDGEVQWPLRKALKIVAFLAHERDFEAAREDLIDAVWPEADEETIEKNFHPTLSHLRRTLIRAWEELLGPPAPKPLVHTAGVYRLNPEIGWRVDALELEEHFEEARQARGVGEEEAALARLEAARTLYRGPFLQGVYEAWTGIPRDRYQRLYQEVLRELADLYIERDRLTDALDAYRMILLEDPLQERVHVSLMRLYGRQGRRDLVRRQYERLSTLLTEELGVQPLPQSTEEYHRLMR